MQLTTVLLSVLPLLSITAAYPTRYSPMPLLAPRDVAARVAESMLEAREAAIESEVRRIVDHELGGDMKERDAAEEQARDL